MGADRKAVRVLVPSSGASLRWGELWGFRELLLLLAWRDVSVRYKQTVLGVGWAILQPILMVVVFSLLFGRLAGLAERTPGGVPYPIYVCAGVLPWSFFAGAVGSGGNSLVNNINLVTKVYFPRLIIPFAAVAAGLVDLAVSMSVLLAMMAFYRVPVTWQLGLLPIVVLGLLLIALGVAAAVAAATAEYRDFRHLVPFALQIWLFVTPVIYPAALVPERWRPLLALNPVAGLIEAFRASVLGQPPAWREASVAFALAACVFWAGSLHFRRVERRFADVI